jgi:hypothetical protein
MVSNGLPLVETNSEMYQTGAWSSKNVIHGIDSRPSLAMGKKVADPIVLHDRKPLNSPFENCKWG